MGLGPVDLLGGTAHMNRTGFALLVGTLFAVTAVAQSPTGAQAGAQASSQTSVQARKEGAQTNAAGTAATSAAAQSGQSNATLANGTAFNAALNAPVDSKKAKQGDAVTAHCTEPVKSGSNTVLPKGTKLVGHVTQASARGKGDAESSLGIVFDKALLKNGQEVALNVAIQAVASPQAGAAAAGSELDTLGSAGASGGASAMSVGRSALGGVTSAAGGTVGSVTNTAANVGGTAGGTVNSTASATANATGSLNGATRGAKGGLNTSGQLTSNSRGVFGLNGINLNSSPSTSTQGSVFTSAGKNVHLDGDTRMLLVTQAAGAPGESKSAAPAKAEPKPEPKSEPKARTENPE